MPNVVKITTFERVADVFCPHSCRVCGLPRGLICGCCKKYINAEVGLRRLPVAGTVFTEGWAVAGRSGRVFGPGAGPDSEAERRDGRVFGLVKEYKYGPVRGMSAVLAQVLCDALPEGWPGESAGSGGSLGSDGSLVSGGSAGRRVVVVPLPTIARHVRQRGFDHVWLLARRLARAKGWEVERALVRRGEAVQVGQGAAERARQAGKAYGVRRGFVADPEAVYLLLDDVWTTGASMRAAGEVLKKAGAVELHAAVVVAEG